MFPSLAWLPAVACAASQTPAATRMPDGSGDIYIGLGASAAPRYAGADASKISAVPALQMAWSNGVFVSGAMLGWHVSQCPLLEFGPLLAWQPPRRADGDGASLGAAGGAPVAVGDVRHLTSAPRALVGMDDIPARLLAGGFFNYYLTPDWRLTNSVLAGAAAAQDGVQWRLGLQRIGIELGRHTTLTLNVGVDFANRAYNQAYSGVSARQAARSGYAPYQSGGGVRQLRFGARWNWALSPAWLLTSGVDASGLVGAAGRSPLAVQPVGVGLSTALGYRF
ncbi:MipA/OmpV family protein [Massilia sp. PWRC2]|uniref:MipA/OmpV family protein n=1 Tax=Massilia sp. PWRC2 TaxID=2804626 RepID=UPI003CF184ED